MGGGDNFADQEIHYQFPQMLNVFLLSFCITASFSKKKISFGWKVSTYELAAVCPRSKISMFMNLCTLTTVRLLLPYEITITSITTAL